MNVFEYHRIVDAFHEQQNPTSLAKLEQLISYCDIADGHQVLDVGCGKGWFLQRLARTHAIAGTGIDVSADSIQQARDMVSAETLRGQLAFHDLPANEFAPEPNGYDIGVCLGASFAVGTFEELLDYLQPAVRPGGLVIVGDIYARTDPMPASSADYFGGGARRTLIDTADMLNGSAFSLRAIVDSSQDDWDHFENLHWYAADRWLADNPDHPDREDFVETHNQLKRDHYQQDRASLGWAMFVAQVRG